MGNTELLVRLGAMVGLVAFIAFSFWQARRNPPFTARERYIVRELRLQPVMRHRRHRAAAVTYQYYRNRAVRRAARKGIDA